MTLSIKPTKLQGLLEEQRRYLEYFFHHFDFAKAQEVIDTCLACRGLIIITGIGKSGIIAEKIAMTLVSTGTRALFVSAQNLLHGDLGIITEEDLVLIMSKSGETKELLDLIPHIRRKRSKTVAITSGNESSLARASNLSICLSVEKELCPFDLLPTTSTAVQLLFGDLLSTALMNEKGFSIEEYAHNHPSGAIGQQITQTVADLMKTGTAIPLCSPDDLLVDVIVELSNKRCGCLLIVDEDNHLLGIFTDGDLRRALQEEGGTVMKKTMNLVMTKSPISVHPTDLVHRAIKSMQSKHYVMVAPVVQDSRVVGLIRLHDIIHQGM